MTASLCDIVFGCLVRFFVNDETELSTSYQPDDNSSLPLEAPR